jgi:ribosomal protein L24
MKTKVQIGDKVTVIKSWRKNETGRKGKVVEIFKPVDSRWPVAVVKMSDDSRRIFNLGDLRKECVK